MIELRLNFKNQDELSYLDDALSTYLDEHREDPEEMLQALESIRNIVERKYYEIRDSKV